MQDGGLRSLPHICGDSGKLDCDASAPTAWWELLGFILDDGFLLVFHEWRVPCHALFDNPSYVRTLGRRRLLAMYQSLKSGPRSCLHLARNHRRIIVLPRPEDLRQPRNYKDFRISAIQRNAVEIYRQLYVCNYLRGEEPKVGQHKYPNYLGLTTTSVGPKRPIETFIK